MAKRTRNIFIVLFGIFAFLFAGFSFAGCGIDYSKVSITTQTPSISLEKGESKDIYFEIENYQKGLEKTISVSEKSGNGAIAGGNGARNTRTFRFSSPVYLSDGRIKVTVTGLAGGNSTLSAFTLDGGKECLVDISVTQYAEKQSDMNSLNELLYVSDDIDFIPDAGLFEFDANVTYKDLSYYVFEKRGDFNLVTYNKLLSIDKTTKIARFTDGKDGYAEASIEQFDSVKFDGEKLLFSYNGEEREADFVDKFGLLSVYNYSVGNQGSVKQGYDEIIYVVDEVYVLPKLQMTISGGYNINGRREYMDIEDGQRIIVVPNNGDMSDFVIKIEVENTISSSPIKIECYQNVPGDDENAQKLPSLLVDNLNDFVEPGDDTANKRIEYWHVISRAQVPGELEFGFVVSYDLDRKFHNDDVNETIGFVGELQVAPTSILVNETTDPRFTLYNYYDLNTNNGWVDMEVGVSTDYGVSPTYDGIYFTYDTNVIEMIYHGAPVAPNKLYSDLSEPFKIRAPQGAAPGHTEVVLHLKSGILQGTEELELAIDCEIVKGANLFNLVDSYQTKLIEKGAFYIEMDAPAIAFENMFYANEAFKSVTAKLVDGQDVAEFVFDSTTPYTIIDDGYYVNFSVYAKTTSITPSRYRLVLDNGVSTEAFAIRAIRTLKEETTVIKLAEDGNKNVTYYDYSRMEEANFDNVLNVEVLNLSDRENITFGTTASIAIVANTTSIEPILQNDVVTISRTNLNYLLSTTKNGDVLVEFILHGYNVEDFETTDVTLNVYVNLTSYSVLSEFYFMHGKDYANPSRVYFGENATIDDNSLALSVVANNPNSSNFYKYNLTNQSLMRLFDEADDYHYDEEIDKYSSIDLRTSDLQLTLVHEVFDRKFIYYNVQDKYGNDLDVATEIVLTKITRGSEDRTEIKTLILSDKGLMFMGDDFEFDYYDEDTGDLVATYSVVFSNVYTIDIGYGGIYDLASLTYMAGADIDTRPVIINATISQRGFSQKSNRMYSMEITPVEFKAVESISLASNLTKLNFSSSKLTYTIGVYTYPTTSTNKSVRVQFVKDAENKYADLISYTVDDSQSANGIYMITISCEDFYTQHRTGAESIEKIACPLTGTIYIYPKEWGNSYTVIGSRQPVVLDIQYRNGAKANPYLIETADDVVSMGANEVMLRSHYEINSVVDMASVKNFVPIGILNGAVTGFSGTLIGSSSQASITNISVSNNNFSQVVDGELIAGLFAQINEGAIIENMLFTGKFNIATENPAKIGLLAATNNKGKIINSGVTIRESSIVGGAGELSFGGLVAINEGYIYQDFKKYSNEEADSSTSTGYKPGYTYNKFANIEQDSETGEYFAWKGGVRYTTDRDGYQIYANGTRVVIDNERNALPSAWRYDGQVSKNIANFTGFVNISSQANVYAGGIAGKTKGEIKRFLPTLSYNMYGYAAYSAITQIKISGPVVQSYLGGVVGNVLPSAQGVVIDNLLVGGEVDSSMITSGKDSVGGLLGRTESGQITITNNTIRTFVRGMHYVGGVAGYENYNSSTGGVKWGTENKLEAVDDGRNAFYSAMVIKYFAEDYDMTADEEQIRGAYFYAVGYYNGRDYSSSSNPATFGKFSYLKRTRITSATNVDRNNTSTTTYYGNYLAVYLLNFEYISDLSYENGEYAFVSKDIDLIVSGPNKLGDDVFFMYYFGVDGLLRDSNQSQAIVQDQVADLNFVSTASGFYPFSLSNTEVKFSAAESNILSFDANQNISVMGCGLSTISLSSILNVNVRRLVYVYVVNYFNKSIDESIYYTSATANGTNVTNDSIINIYGNSATTIYVVPNYQLEDARTSNGDRFSITKGGMLSFKNVSYVLSKNTLITSSTQKMEGEDISAVQVNKQTIVFRKTSTAEEDKLDRYKLTPVLQVSFVKDGVVADYEYALAGGIINVDVVYKEAAKSIKPKFDFNAMETNNTLKDLIYVDSTNSSEKLFYQIYKLTEDGQRIIVQDKMPLATSEVSSYVITILRDDLFDLTLKRVSDDNTFEYTLKVNKDSDQFANRLNQNIYGEYVVVLYASQLLEGVTGIFTFRLDEANVNYVSLINHSDSADISLADQILVPAQAGLLEIAVDPVEAAFNQITISNNEINSENGAGIANFTFVYENRQPNGVIEYVRVPAFATNVNGAMTFSYEELQRFLEEQGQAYKGKIYIEYLMPAYDVQDGMLVAFDVSVEHGENNEVETSTIELVTKLSSYARLEIVGKESIGDSYYVARGLSYDLSLSYYGYLESEITISTTNESLASVSHENGVYKLNISTTQPSREADRDIDIITHAEKIVDDKTIFYEHTIRIHIMEYVFNYVYSEDKNEDIVKGMKNGIIDDAIGTPYTLELFVDDFIEYDTTSNIIAEEVATFVEKLTNANAVKWKVYLYDTETELEAGKTIRTDFYSIKSYTFTPLKIYNADSGIYHFSVSAKYSISVGGLYSVSEDGNYRLYTEFSFDVHQQSTEESPVPIETYEEFAAMKAGEWYILMQDIVLPNSYNTKQFEPIAEEIAGLDGNSHNLIFTGDYTFEEKSAIGVFEFIGENAVVKNLNVLIVNDTVFNIGVDNFTFGVVAAENRGVVTNCATRSVGNALLSVKTINDDATDSYVAGLIAANSGHITHSRAQVNMITPENLAGFVAQNSGHIASSYFMGASLTNTARSNYVAGFVIENTGDIYTSYTSGDPSESRETIYYDGTLNTIRSAGYIAGFVFKNEGNVCDCYSNLNMSNQASAGSDIAGFVFENAGNINRCISTSLLKSNETKSFGFVREITSTDNQAATFADCFYLSDADEGINVSIEANRAENVKELNIAGFANLNNFKSFAIANGRDMKAVWFFSTATGGENFNGATFLANRLELVAPNILATSIRQLDHIENIIDPDSGAAYAKYVYVYTAASPAPGSVYNPIVIYDYKTMEDYIVSANNRAGQNYGFYRIVNDIDYSENEADSQLYKTRFMGYLEGNFMTISDISLISNETLTSAGLFAEVGNSGDRNAYGAIMNLTVMPRTISFNNSKLVGGLTGKMDSATLFNLNFVYNSDPVIVSGKNIVGGVVGLAVGNYKIQNVYSNLGARASHVTGSEASSNIFNEINPNYDSYSYAGTLVGVLAGNGNVYDCLLKDTDEVAVLADKAGLLFGLATNDVRIEKVYVNMNLNMLLNAYTYGGLVIGQSSARMADIHVIGTGIEFTNVRKVPFIPTAIGGIVGLFSGGSLTNVSNTQSIVVASRGDSVGVRYLGGIVGVASASVQISQASIGVLEDKEHGVDAQEAAMKGFMYVGGAVGGITDGIVKITDVDICTSLSGGGRSQTKIGVGGLVGFVDETAKIELTTSSERYALSKPNMIVVKNIDVAVYCYGESDVMVNVGSVLGFNTSLIGNTLLNTNSFINKGNVQMYEFSTAVTPYSGKYIYKHQTTNPAQYVNPIMVAATGCNTEITELSYTLPTVSDDVVMRALYALNINVVGEKYVPPQA